MTLKIPETFFGKSTRGDYIDVEKHDSDSDETPPPPSNIQAPENYIILPGKTRGTYSYNDLLVAKQTTYKGKTWEEAYKAIQQESFFMLTPRQFADFLNLLRTGTARDGKGTKIDEKDLNKILDEIYKTGKDETGKDLSWRAEWLDAYFTEQNGIWYMNYNHRLKGNNLEPQNREQLKGCLMQDKKPGISMEYWLKNANQQGLPLANTPKGDLWYWHPIKDSVAWFYADSGRADLNCDGLPRFSYSSLGVRRAREK